MFSGSLLHWGVGCWCLCLTNVAGCLVWWPVPRRNENPVACMYIYTCVYIYVYCICVYVYIFILYMYIHVYKYLYISIHICFTVNYSRNHLINRGFLPNLHDTRQHLSANGASPDAYIKWPLVPSMRWKVLISGPDPLCKMVALSFLELGKQERSMEMLPRADSIYWSSFQAIYLGNQEPPNCSLQDVWSSAQVRDGCKYAFFRYSQG